MNAARIVAGVLALGQIGFAQEPGTSPPPDPAPAAVADASAQKPIHARIAGKEVHPRCFASAVSPVYSDVLAEGQVVQVGESKDGFRTLTLPMGVTGFVHKKFATEPVDGIVTATGSNVSFRYRPQTSEVPAALLSKGAQLTFLAEDAEWWTVRSETVTGYVAESEVTVEPATPEVEQAWADFVAARRAEWDAAVQARGAAMAAAAELEKQRTELDGLYAVFRAEAARPVEEQNFAPVTEGLDRLTPLFAEGSPERARADDLRKEVERQALLARALRAVAEEPPTRNLAADILPEEVRDPMARFDGVGWLTREQPLGRPERFTLTKGGKLLFVVTCSSGRYDLALFDGAEIGIKGAKSSPSPDSVRELDVMRIEVLRTSE